MAARRSIAILIDGILLAGAAAHAASVRGQLLFPNNAPASYIAVRLNSPARGPSQFAYSGTDGRFYLNNVPAGSYQLEVWRGNKVVVRVDVNVQEPVADLPPTHMP